MAVGENIKRIRLQRGLTQEKLGSLVGMSGTMVRKYELGIVNPRKKRLEALATALGVNVEVLKSEDMDTVTAMHLLFQLFSKYEGAFDQSENLYFQKLNIQPLYDRWMQYQADMKEAEMIFDEREKMRVIQTVEESFQYWMDTYR